MVSCTVEILLRYEQVRGHSRETTLVNIFWGVTMQGHCITYYLFKYTHLVKPKTLLHIQRQAK